MSVSALRWPIYAVLGLLVALAIALLATRLVSERIGISSEPITAGESLSPNRGDGDERARHRQQAAGGPVQTTSTTRSGYVGPSSSGGDPSDGGSDSTGAERKDIQKGGLQPSGTPPAASTPAPSAPSAGGTGTTTQPEPGDD